MLLQTTILIENFEAVGKILTVTKLICKIINSWGQAWENFFQKFLGKSEVFSVTQLSLLEKEVFEIAIAFCVGNGC